MFCINRVCSSPDCDTHTHKGCEYCVSQPSWSENCRWCTLDNECHAKGSFLGFNPCSSSGVIKRVMDCPKDQMYGTYSPEMAYELVKMSAVAYADTIDIAYKCMDKLFENHDFQIVEFVGRHCEQLPLFDYQMCLSITAISHQRKAIVVAYRGSTSVQQVLDQILTILTVPKDSSGIGGEVQRYFRDAHNKLYTCIHKSVKDYLQLYPDYDVMITGHSLGGAVASILSGKLVHDSIIKPDQMALYTFGMPKVGDRDYAVAHNKLVNNSWRLVHREDPVPHYPTSTPLPTSPFHHRTEVYYRTKKMSKDSSYTVCPNSDDNNCGSSFSLGLNGGIEDHMNYFNIPVGTFCNNLSRKKRSTTKEHSDLWNKLSSDRCTRIKSTHYKQRANVGPHATVSQKGLFLIMTVLMVLEGFSLGN